LEGGEGALTPPESADDGRPKAADAATTTATERTMAAMGRYDSTLQMFVQEPRDLDLRRLSFLRWLGENGRLEHDIAGPSSGPLLVANTRGPVKAKGGLRVAV
jgi:hypothetical protein